MRRFIKIMKALSDPNRVTMLKLLEHRDLCVCEVQACLGLAQPTVSRHLKVLEEAGLVVREKDGQWVNYRLNSRGDGPYNRELLGLLTGWLNDDRSVAELVARLPEIDREEVCRG